MLQVTTGCSYNQCSFCTMYKDADFSIEHIDQIEADLQETRRLRPAARRVFLVNGDAFSLSARKLKEICSKIIYYFPEMETITMYASIRNIKHKGEQELRELQALRINDLWVGIESGSSEVLRHLNKGYGAETAIEQLGRLDKAGIRHNGIFMLGVAGKGKGVQNAIETAKLINTTQPQLVGVTTLGFFEESKLNREVEANSFIPATEREILEEEMKLIELINVKGIPFYGDHPINTISIDGILPQDRKDMLEALQFVIGNMDQQILDSTIQRSAL